MSLNLEQMLFLTLHCMFICGNKKLKKKENNFKSSTSGNWSGLWERQDKNYIPVSKSVLKYDSVSK